jgi:hypothetical protein
MIDSNREVVPPWENNRSDRKEDREFISFIGVFCRGGGGRGGGVAACPMSRGKTFLTAILRSRRRS